MQSMRSGAIRPATAADGHHCGANQQSAARQSASKTEGTMTYRRPWLTGAMAYQIMTNLQDLTHSTPQNRPNGVPPQSHWPNLTGPISRPQSHGAQRPNLTGPNLKCPISQGSTRSKSQGARRQVAA